MAYTEQEFEQKLRDDASQRGVQYDPSDLEDARHRDFSDDALRIADKKYDYRSDNTPNQPQNDNNNGRSNPWTSSSPRDTALTQVSQVYSGASTSAPAAAAAQTPAVAAAAVTPWTQGLRDILMGQLGELQKPVTENDPGIRDVLAGERIASQRGAERMQSASAERLAASGLHDSGAADTSRQGILQHQGEQDAQFTGQTLGRELESRRSQLTSMMQMALANGDTESARKLQAAIADMNNAYQYSALSQNQNQFNDQLGYNYNALSSNNNLQALLGLLGAA